VDVIQHRRDRVDAIDHGDGNVHPGLRRGRLCVREPRHAGGVQETSGRNLRLGQVDIFPDRRPFGDAILSRRGGEGRDGMRRGKAECIILAFMLPLVSSTARA
jgi:hypothetical protein